MDNDIGYVVMMTSGTTILMIATFFKGIAQKASCYILAGIMFLQSGICVQNGLCFNRHEIGKFKFLTITETKESKIID